MIHGLGVPNVKLGAGGPPFQPRYTTGLLGRGGACPRLSDRHIANLILGGLRGFLRSGMGMGSQAQICTFWPPALPVPEPVHQNPSDHWATRRDLCRPTVTHTMQGTAMPTKSLA